LFSSSSFFFVVETKYVALKPAWKEVGYATNSAVNQRKADRNEKTDRRYFLMKAVSEI